MAPSPACGRGLGRGIADRTETEYQHPLMQIYWKQLDSGFPQVAEVFENCMAEALAMLTREGLSEYLDAARFLGKMGRGPEPILVVMEEWPSVAKAVGEDALVPGITFVRAMSKSPNGNAITPFLQTLAAVARRQPAPEQLQHYLDIA